MSKYFGTTVLRKGVKTIKGELYTITSEHRQHLLNAAYRKEKGLNMVVRTKDGFVLTKGRGAYASI